jgi:anaerobic magnesium-protoporphyrin IX monomethyl ester cyclase
MPSCRHRTTKTIVLLYRGPQSAGRDEFTSFVPAGFFNILKSLLAAGYRATLYNLSETPPRLLRQTLADIAADAFFLSTFYGNHLESARLASLLKKLYPGVPVVLGGPFAVLGGEILKRWPQVDFVVRGEGERAGVSLLDELFSGEYNFSAVDGLCRRTGSSIHCRPPILLNDIDRFFFLPSEILPHCIGVSPDNLAVLISSRGCPYHCAFCSSTALWNNRLRHHSVPLLIDYLKDLRKTTGAIYFSLRDENFLANKQQVKEFTELLNRENLYYLFNVQGSAALVDKEGTARLAAAGCDQLQMGIETISPRLQSILQKKQRPETIRSGIALLRRRLIRPFGYFIYGMGETKEETDENLTFIRTSGLLDAVASPLVHYPGTSLSATMPTDSFFSDREILYFDEVSRKNLRPRYRKALRFLAQKASFRDNEINKAELSHLPAEITRFFHFLSTGQTAEAENLLLAMTVRQPDNPWGYSLLGDLYAELGETKKAREYLHKATKIRGIE